jgi:WD40 repeat protein
VTDVAWSPDGTKIASASLDNLVFDWNVHTGQQVRHFGTGDSPLVSGNHARRNLLFGGIPKAPSIDGFKEVGGLMPCHSCFSKNVRFTRMCMSTLDQLEPLRPDYTYHYAEGSWIIAREVVYLA